MMLRHPSILYQRFQVEQYSFVVCSTIDPAMVASASFVTLDAALEQPHGSEVDIIAVVASIGPLNVGPFDPFATREICLKDTRLVMMYPNFFYINNYGAFLEMTI